MSGQYTGIMSNVPIPRRLCVRSGQFALKGTRASTSICNTFAGSSGTRIWKLWSAAIVTKLVACLSGYHPHPLYVVCTHFPE